MCVTTGDEKAQFDLNYLTIPEAYYESTFEAQIMLVISIIKQHLFADTTE